MLQCKIIIVPWLHIEKWPHFFDIITMTHVTIKECVSFNDITFLGDILQLCSVMAPSFKLIDAGFKDFPGGKDNSDGTAKPF